MRRNQEQRLSKLAAVAIFGTVLLCGFSTWQRDSATRERECARLEPLRDALAGQLAENGHLPTRASLEHTGLDRLADRYLSEDGQTYFHELPEPVILAQGPLVRQYVHYNGRVLIVYRNGDVRVEWWNSGPAGRAWYQQVNRIKAIVDERMRTPPALP